MVGTPERNPVARCTDIAIGMRVSGQKRVVYRPVIANNAESSWRWTTNVKTVFAWPAFFLSFRIADNELHSETAH